VTLAEKILARPSSRETVARVWDPSKIVIVFDHRIPAESQKTATTYCRGRTPNLVIPIPSSQSTSRWRPRTQVGWKVMS
jgi:homoaconitase/3-isopropylmalate dehydratase large subunit